MIDDIGQSMRCRTNEPGCNPQEGSVKSEGVAKSEDVGNLPQPPSAVWPSLDAETMRNWWQRLRDWLWGYDFFVSYHWVIAKGDAAIRENAIELGIKKSLGSGKSKQTFKRDR